MRPLIVLCIICAAALSATDTPPEITNQVPSLSGNYGAPMTLWVSASGSPAPAFRWQRAINGASWVDLPGGASASFTKTIELLDSDAGFRCIVSNGAGSVTSFERYAQCYPVFTSTPVINAIVGVPYTYTATLNVPTENLMISGPTSLPPGLTWNSTTNTLSGTPTQVGTYAIGMTAQVVIGGRLTGGSMFQRFNLGVREAGNTLPVISAASVTPTTVTETTALLSVTATDDGGETNLTYTWSSLNPRLFWLPSSFTPNGTNAAKTCTVQFSTPGTFTFRVTVKDAANGQAFRDVSVTVQDVLTTLTAAPVSVEVVQGSGKALGFNALNQFNKAMNPPSEVTWTKVSGIGTVSADGFYQSPADQTGQAVVRVSSGTKTADVNISVIAQPKAPVITSVPPSTVVQGSDVRYSVTVTGVPAPNYTVTGLPLGGNGSLKWYEEGQYFVIYGSTCPVGTVLGPVTLRVSNGINPDAIQIFSVTITGAGGVPGDLNHDGHVTFDDLAGWLSAFGKAKGESGYNAEADLVTTGSSANVVDFDDFTIFLARYEN